VRIILSFLLIALGTLPSLTLASRDLPSIWNYVHIKTEDGRVIEISTDQKSSTISGFKVTINDVSSKLDNKWFIDIPNPDLSTIKITDGCLLTLDEHDQVSMDCSDIISFNFYDTKVTFKGNTIPEWFQDPKVIYYFEDGLISSRLVQINDKKGHWTNYWMHFDGRHTRGEQKVIGSYEPATKGT
jgi:hypothetical protein